MRRKIFLFSILIFTILIVPFESSAQSRGKLKRKRSARTSQKRELRGDKEFAYAIKANSWVSHLININSIERLQARFEAQGGGRNDVEVYIFDQDGLTNFKNGNSAQTYYNSQGSKTVGNIDVVLSNGLYWIVFKNPAWFDSKAVRLTLYNQSLARDQ